MLKLPTSLFECVCFICVNIVSFTSLRASRSPGLFIPASFQPNLQQTKHELSMLRRKSNELCASMLMYFSILSLPRYSVLWISFFFPFSFPEFYFSVYSTLRSPSEVRYTIWRGSPNPESLNCAFGLPYIKINSLSARRTGP